MNRRELQALAEARLKDAQALYQAKRFDGAYYLAGNAIECAIKACIAKKTKKHDFPDKELGNKAYTHDVTLLLRLADIAEEFDREIRRDADLDDHWGVLKDWNEKSRYGRHGRAKAKALPDAVAGPQGVLACLKGYW